MASASKLIVLRRLLGRRTLKPVAASSYSIITSTYLSPVYISEPSTTSTLSPSLCSFRLSFHDDVSLGPVPVDYSCMLQEDEFHSIADSTIHDLLEKIEEYSDNVDIDGFDIDYGNQVLTVKLGGLGTYVLNKQTPNRQIWMSSPVSGPSRFDWDRNAQAWIYRRNKEHLLKVMERELEQLCGEPISLS